MGSQYLGAFVDAPAAPVALCIVAWLTVVAWLGVGTSARLVAVMTVVEVSGLLLVVAAGVTGWFDGSAEPARLVDPGSTGADSWGVFGAAALAFFAYLGFEDAVHLSEEVDDPARSFPMAMLVGLAVVGVLYVGVTMSVGSLLDPDVLAACLRRSFDETVAVGGA